MKTNELIQSLDKHYAKDAFAIYHSWWIVTLAIGFALVAVISLMLLLKYRHRDVNWYGHLKFILVLSVVASFCISISIATCKTSVRVAKTAYLKEGVVKVYELTNPMKKPEWIANIYRYDDVKQQKNLHFERKLIKHKNPHIPSNINYLW